MITAKRLLFTSLFIKMLTPFVGMVHRREKNNKFNLRLGICIHLKCFSLGWPRAWYFSMFTCCFPSKMVKNMKTKQKKVHGIFNSSSIYSRDLSHAFIVFCLCLLNTSTWNIRAHPLRSKVADRRNEAELDANCWYQELGWSENRL